MKLKSNQPKATAEQVVKDIRIDTINLILCYIFVGCSIKEFRNSVGGLVDVEHLSCAHTIDALSGAQYF